MKKKEDVFIRKCEAHQVKVSRFGMSDNPIAAKSMIPAMKAADLDVLFVDMVTYATSSTFAPFVRELNVPIVLFCLQPDERLDYEHATICKQLMNDDLCSVPEFTGVAERYGKPGKGAGVEFNIKEGPITMMSLGLKRDGSFKFIVAEGESLRGPIPPTGNTNTHGKFFPDVRTFLRRWSLAGPPHHFALGVGHHAAELKKVGQ